MSKYNIVYEANIDVLAFTTKLESLGVTVEKSFPSMKVLTIEASSEDFTSLSEIVDWELDVSIEPIPSAWHQLRAYSSSLPMLAKFYAKNLGENSVVYLIDSGINLSHTEFETATIENLYSFDASFDDAIGHGTGMASLIVGKTLGMVPNATLKNVKIPMLTQIPVSDLLLAFDTVLQDHALTPTVKVVNCSWVIEKSRILDMKITELQNANLVVVAAAGNKGEAADNYSPVGLNTVLGVAASDPYDRVISWGPGVSSNWGPEVDITAPGIGVEVAMNDGTIGTASGTSLSSAIVAGIAAQYIVEFADLTAAQIQQKIIDNARADFLFRNESVYGTTPNLLIAALGVSEYFDFTQTQRIAVQLGTEVSHAILFKDEIIKTINYQGVIQFGMPRVNPDWLTFDFETKTMTLTPPADYTPGLYRIYLEGLDAENDRIAVATFIINVFAEDPIENEGENVEEKYLRPDGDTVMVLPAPCSTNFCFGGYSCSGTPFGKNQVCACVGYGCGSFSI